MGLAILVVTGAGCAHAPSVSPSAAEARNRLLQLFGREDPATRGAGMLSIRYGSKRRGGLNTRWATVADSFAVVAYMGPVRALDAAVLGDSVYVALRPRDLVLAGPIPRNEGLGPRGLRFLARPWDFGAPWVREAVERARVEPFEKGWRLLGSLRGSEGEHRFALDLNNRSEPTRLTIQKRSDEEPLITIQYGPVRRFDLGKAPRWVEWSRATTRIRIDIEEHGRGKPTRFWHPPQSGENWTILALDDPRGRDLLRKLLGIGEDSAP